MIAFIPVLVSYVGAMLERSDSSLGIRTVEWIRDNGARGLVNSVENLYYTLTAPSKGGPALHRLPKQAGAVHGSTASHKVHYYRPPTSGRSSTQRSPARAFGIRPSPTAARTHPC